MSRTYILPAGSPPDSIRRSPLAMSPTTRKALLASIANWEQRVAGTYDGPDGRAGCPLCQLFDPDHLNDCAGCPVKKRTGRSSCTNTPYDAWGKAPLEAECITAQAEVDFLKSLLPPDPQADTSESEA